MDHIEYARIQAAFRDALKEAMLPYKGKALTPTMKAEIKKKTIAITCQMIPARMDPNELERFIDGILDLHKL